MAAKIDETDEMKLKMLTALNEMGSEDKLYPSELNSHLLEQLQVMTGDNNQLRKCVYTKQIEIKELNKTISDLNQRIKDIIIGTGPAISSKSAGIISAKITELCKQNRHLVAEVEGYKTKLSILERKLMQNEIFNKEKEEAYKMKESCFCNNDPDPDELKELNSKLTTVNRKLYESKNRNLELKNEILVATKILQQELGDKFTSIKELQNDLAGWKGRAQQITILQNKIAELEEKLNGKNSDLSDSHHKNQMQLIRDLESKRKRENDQAMKDLENIKIEHQEVKKKLDAARARIRNLECDSTTLRQKMQTFVEKSNHDDVLINEQRGQIKNIEQYYQDMLNENTVKMKKMRNEIDNYKKESSNTNSKIDALRQQTSEKASKIEELRRQLSRYEECSLQNVFFTPMKTATDNEIKTLTALVQELNTRINNERHKLEDLEDANKKLKGNKKRSERKISLLNEEIKKLKELKNSKGSKATFNKDLFSESGTLSHLTIKRKSSVGIVSEKQSDSTTLESVELDSSENLEKEDLKFKLEVADEKLKILEDKIKMLEEEKADDYNNLLNMIQTSKQLFNEALTVLQKEKCNCK